MIKAEKRKKCKDIVGCQNAGTAHISLWDSHSPYVPERYTQWRSISAAQRAGRKRTGGRLNEKREKGDKECTWWDLCVGSCSLACSTEEEREPQMDLERERDKGERNVAGELKVSSEFPHFSHVTSAATIHVLHQRPETCVSLACSVHTATFQQVGEWYERGVGLCVCVRVCERARACVYVCVWLRW